MGEQHKMFIDALNDSDFSTLDIDLPFIIGLDDREQIIIKDLSDVQHLLIAGASGTGKSTLGHEIILSLIHQMSPDDLRLILCDTKLVEYSTYNYVPHLLIPIVYDLSRMENVLQWAMTEVKRRLSMISQEGFRSIDTYNSKMRLLRETTLPHILLLIDDAAEAIDSEEEKEKLISLAMNSRAAGFHLILITQNPSSKKLTEIIKSSIPTRAAFSLISSADKRLLFGSSKEPLPSQVGDMVWFNAISKKPEHLHCFPVTDSLMQTVTEEAKAKYKASPSTQIPISHSSFIELSPEGAEGDEMLPAAVDIILETEQASVSMLQKRLKLGYSRAARLIDEMEEKGIVGPFLGSKPRQILITKEEWQRQMSNRTFDSTTVSEPTDRPSAVAKTNTVLNASVSLSTQKKPWYHRITEISRQNLSKQVAFDPEYKQLRNESVVISVGQEDDFFQKHPLLDDIYTKAVGVTYNNDDGSSRQEIISQCESGDEVMFRFFTFHGEPAIAIITKYGQIGFLSANLAKQIEYTYGCDPILHGKISNITGGNGLSYGCNLRILVYKNNCAQFVHRKR